MTLHRIYNTSNIHANVQFRKDTNFNNVSIIWQLRDHESSLFIVKVRTHTLSIAISRGPFRHHY